MNCPPLPERPGGHFYHSGGIWYYRTPHLLMDAEVFGRIAGWTLADLAVEAICLGAWGADPAGSVNRARLWQMGACALAEWDQLERDPTQYEVAHANSIAWADWLAELEARP